MRIISGCAMDFSINILLIIGRYISKELVQNYLEGYCVAIDVTARDLQQEAQGKGLPWTLAKGQDTFCPIR